MNEHFTMQYCGGPGSRMGDTAVPTALGAYLALKEAVRFKTGSNNLAGMTVAVQGLGAVGYSMAENLLSENARIIVADIDNKKIERLLAAYPNYEIKVADTSNIIFEEADILCPCAMGGIIGEEEIPKLNVKYIFGPANNQLRATNQDEEIRLAKSLDARGILFQTEWWHNGAGVLGAAMEYIQETRENLEKRVREIIPARTWENLNRAKELGITPTEAAYLRCQDEIYK